MYGCPGRRKERGWHSHWLHIWRVTGKWANTSIFRVNDADELHEILTALPLFRYMEIEVIALNRHPASIEEATTGD
ncbi:muconolactone Delta-isomerase family protein [Luteibacter sp. OK325]|uniref:muconolactone Delta-isomerase family protein n=1 Tax=Luteibacter sp. OK325 TaxID=2135670 RepID=UPI002100F66C|nr:muconolactone Delta-isomerase family protein [Luteibacter sp. OK325]